MCLYCHNKRVPKKQSTEKAFVRTKEYVWRQNKGGATCNILMNLILHSNEATCS